MVYLSHVSSGSKLPFLRRIHTTAMFASSIRPSPSASDLALLALLSHPLPSRLSSRSWAKAGRLSTSKQERLIFDLSVDEAFALYDAGLAALRRQPELDAFEGEGEITVLGVIATGHVCTVLKQAASNLFITSVTAPPVKPLIAGEDDSNSLNSGSRPLTGVELAAKQELADAVEIAKSITEPVRSLVALWEAASVSSLAQRALLSDIDCGNAEDDETATDLLSNTRSILRATLLFKQLSTACVPGSPALSDSSLSSWSSGSSTPTTATITTGIKDSIITPRLTLLRVLASPAFDQTANMEDARDRMVDLLRDRQ